MLSRLLGGAALAPTLAGAPIPIPCLYLIVEPVDMRLGIDGLSALVQQRLNVSPCAGALYGFANARRTRMKLLLWDATGVWLAQRRLHRGGFVWPGMTVTSNTTANSRAINISEAALAWLITGVDWTRLCASVSEHEHSIVS